MNIDKLIAKRIPVSRVSRSITTLCQIFLRIICV